MTETEKKALALVNEVREERDESPLDKLNRDHISSQEALCRTIEQFEVFRQEVSDAVETLLAWPSIRSQGILVSTLNRFIIAKPDPLVEALKDCGFDQNYMVVANNLNAALAARGLEIREKQP
ncbi:hypothetical protein ACQKOE_10070 [Novosphingobium sp. NPDC080210]|uniref:hypothetical protein n=1 Tax=Novosphingobium sp. NPDC080210 TaxID=3390596 RepID=UPI003CFF8EAA